MQGCRLTVLNLRKSRREEWMMYIVVLSCCTLFEMYFYLNAKQISRLLRKTHEIEVSQSSSSEENWPIVFDQSRYVWIEWCLEENWHSTILKTNI